MRLQESFLIFKAKWLGITSRQKMGVATLVFLLLALPLSVGAVLTRQYLGSRASMPVTPPITGPTEIPSPTETPRIASCNEFCTTDSQCGGMSCIKDVTSSLGRCRSLNCPGKIDCICDRTASPSATPKPTRSPTSRPTSTATPIPSYKPTLTPIPSYKPTSTPVANRAPVISTSMLNIARRNTNYNMTISGYDLDIENILSLNVTGLPNGITQRNCNQTYLQNNRGIGRMAITCRYAGVATKRGVYTLRAVLRDNQGGVKVKSLFLLVW